MKLISYSISNPLYSHKEHSNQFVTLYEWKHTWHNSSVHYKHKTNGKTLTIFTFYPQKFKEKCGSTQNTFFPYNQPSMIHAQAPNIPCTHACSLTTAQKTTNDQAQSRLSWLISLHMLPHNTHMASNLSTNYHKYIAKTTIIHYHLAKKPCSPHGMSLSFPWVCVAGMNARCHHIFSQSSSESIV